MAKDDLLKQLTAKLTQTVDDEIRQQYAQLKRPNVLVAGRTGVGKSTLINALFGAQVARVGSGRPVTDCYTLYRDEHTLVNLYDSTGWEGGADKEASFLADTARFLAAHRTADPLEHIHVVWYVIDAPGARFTDFDARLAAEAFAGLPVMFLLTKADIASDEQLATLRAAIEAAGISNARGIIDVAAEPLVRRGQPVCEPFGLADVITRTLQMLPDLVKRAFISAQQVSLQLKNEEARSTVLALAAGAFGIGFTPIPFADAPLLMTLQAGLVAKLAVIYGFPPRHAALASVGSLVTGLAASAAGTFLANMLKFLPGIGTLVGGLIDGSIAASLTVAIGFTFRSLFAAMFERRMEGKTDEVSEGWVSEFVQKEFEKNWQAYKGKKPEDVN